MATVKIHGITLDVMGKRVELEYVEPPIPPELPDSEPEPTTGTRGLPGDWFYRVVHDWNNPGMNYESRTLIDKKLKITNEMYPPRRWYLRDGVGWRVDKYSKVSFWPELLSPGWEEHFFSGMSARQRELFNLLAFGWRDGKADAIMRLIKRIMGVTDGPRIYNFILCGGALLKGTGAKFREFTLFTTQNTNNPPDTSTSIYTAPDKWFLQGVTGHNPTTKESFCGSINQVQGRLAIPTACPSGVAAIPTTEIRRIPALPLETHLFDVPVTIVEYRFIGADTMGKLSNGDWYYIQQQVSQNGNASDFVTNVPGDDWVSVLPVPVVDRQKS